MTQDTEDDLSRAWWGAMKGGKLRFQRCAACGDAVFYPRVVCPACFSDRLSWEDSSGRGSVHSFTIVHHAPTPALKAIVPYPVVLVDLDEGFRFMARAVATGETALKVGQRVTLTVETQADGSCVPCFRPDGR